MSNLNKKLREWNDKVERGNDKYIKIAPCKNEMFYMFYGKPYRIKSIKVLIDTGEGMKLHYQYDDGIDGNSDFVFSAIIKNRKAIMVQDEKQGLLSFGLGEHNQAVKSMMVHIRTNTFNTIIMTDSDSDSIVMFEEIIYSDVNVDPVSVCLSKLISNIDHRTGGNDGI